MRERRINRKHHALIAAKLQAVEVQFDCGTRILRVIPGAGRPYHIYKPHYYQPRMTVPENVVDKSVSILIYCMSTLTDLRYGPQNIVLLTELTKLFFRVL